MVGEVMTLPVRAGVRVTRLALHMTLTASARALTLVGGALQSATGHNGQATQAPPSPAPVLDSTPPPVAEAIEPAHVSEEPELVAELAEPGAEEGAGASVTVDEPWDGYALLKATDVVDRLARAGSAELAAIQLYESSHKQRETVLTAVTREFRRQTAGAPDQPRENKGTNPDAREDHQ
jgi:hypothetical protein